MAEDALPVRARMRRGRFLVAAVLATLLLSTAVVLGVPALGGPETFLARLGPFAPLVALIVIVLAGFQLFPGGEVLLVAQGALSGAAIGGAGLHQGAAARAHRSEGREAVQDPAGRPAAARRNAAEDRNGLLPRDPTVTD